MGEWDAALQRVAAESLEALSGVIPAPRETAVQSAAPWEAAYRVEFEGAARGEMRLTFFGGAAAAVAEGMIGRGKAPTRPTPWASSPTLFAGISFRSCTGRRRSSI